MRLLRRSLEAKVLTLCSLLMILVFAGLFWANAHWQRISALNLIKKSATEISEILFEAISEPMAMGDNEKTVELFHKVASRYSNIVAYLTNFKGEVAYTTRSETLGKDLAQVVTLPEFVSLFSTSLSREIKEGRVITMSGTPYFVEVSTIKNGPACHHCHGANRPILGAMIMFNNISDEFQSLKDDQFNGGLISLAGLIVLMVLLLGLMKTLVINKIVSIDRFTAEIGKGNYNASLHVAGEDEFANMSNHLSQMVNTIRNQLEYNKGILQSIIVPLFVTDTQERIEYANLPMLNILGRGEEDVLGKNITQVFDAPASSQGFTEAVIKLGQSQGGVIEFKRHDGAMFPLHYEISPLRDSEGKVTAAIGVMIDMTQEVRDRARIKAHGENLMQVGEEVTRVATKMATAAEQLTGQMRDLTKNVEDTSRQTDGLAAAMQEMSATVLQVANNAGQVAQASDNANSVARGGGEEVRKTIGEISEVSHRADKLAHSLNDLSGKAQNIGQIMSVINDIADQTNLLALNAAIEAARAGEAGRGFAVVADEVRKLAEKTMHATKEVEQAVRLIQQSTSEAVREMGETKHRVDGTAEMAGRAGKVLETIVTQADEIAGMVQGIAAASEEQSATSDEINRSVSQINLLSQDIHQRIQDANSAIHEVHEMSQRLSTLVEGFREAH